MHTGSDPPIVQVGAGVTVTVLVPGPAVGQLSRVQLTDSVNGPGAPAFTVTEAPLAEPTIVPFPLIDQVQVTVPPLGETFAV